MKNKTHYLTTQIETAAKHVKKNGELLRNCFFKPFASITEPRYRVELFDMNTIEDQDRTRFGYVITEIRTTWPAQAGNVRTVVYAGHDWLSAACRMHADDSDQTIYSLLTHFAAEAECFEADQLCLDAASRFGIEA